MKVLAAGCARDCPCKYPLPVLTIAPLTLHASTTATMDQGKKVWAPDSANGFILGEISDFGTDTLTVQPMSGGKVSTQSILPDMHPGYSLCGIEPPPPFCSLWWEDKCSASATPVWQCATLRMRYSCRQWLRPSIGHSEHTVQFPLPLTTQS